MGGHGRLPRSTPVRPPTKSKQAPKPHVDDNAKKISNLKNVDSKLANMILNDVVERYGILQMLL